METVSTVDDMDMSHQARTAAPNLSPVQGSRRGQPGRPRKGDVGIVRREFGHNAGTATRQPRAARGDEDRTQVQVTVVPVGPRLLDLPNTALYLAVSPWTVRELEAAGSLHRVRIPLPQHGELRKLLFDRADLDRLIEGWKA
jgi:hypothetical protein